MISGWREHVEQWPHVDSPFWEDVDSNRSYGHVWWERTIDDVGFDGQTPVKGKIGFFVRNYSSSYFFLNVAVESPDGFTTNFHERSGLDTCTATYSDVLIWYANTLKSAWPQIMQDLELERKNWEQEEAVRLAKIKQWKAQNA